MFGEVNNEYMFEELNKNLQHIRKKVEIIERAQVISEFYDTLTCPEEMKILIVLLEFYGDSDFMQSYYK